jgi:hypothetical protein
MNYSLLTILLAVIVAFSVLFGILTQGPLGSI